MSAPNSTPAADRPKGWSTAVIAAWAVAGVAEVLFSTGASVTPELPWLIAELVAFVGIGILIARFVPFGWRSALVTPATVLIVSAVWQSGALARWAQKPSYAVAPILALVAMRVFHALTHRFPSMVVAVVLSLLGGGISRFITLVGGKTAAPFSQWMEDIQRPLEALKGTPATPDTAPIIVISVDTLRADHAKEMEAWKWFADRGATWTAAQSTASWTVPSIGSVWTGLLPAQHGAGDLPVGFASLKPEEQGVITLAEQAREAGWDTAAFVANPFVSTTMGFRRGFQQWINPDESVAQPLALFGKRWALPGRDGEVVVQHAIDYLETAPDTGFLLWVHLFDPHLPYTHLEEGHEALKVDHPHQIRKGRIKATPSLKEAVREAYATEVAYSDKALMRLLAAIEARGLDQTARFVFFSDHGEELWEHNDFEHGHSHHGEVTEVPLALVAPCVQPGARTGVVSLQDIAPTLRAISDLPDVPAGPQGYNLCNPIPESRVVLAAGNLYGSHEASGRTLTEKVIERRKKGGNRPAKLYDLTTDPGETRGSRPPTDHPVLLEVTSIETAADGQNAAPVPTEQLCALGYVECDDQE